MKIHINKIKEISEAVLLELGVPGEQVPIIADTILYAHMRGKDTHGIRRLPIYARKIKRGLMNPVTNISPCMDQETITVIDANNGFGQVAAFYAVQYALRKSEQYGVSISFVQHSNNFGAAGYFAKQAAENEKIAIVMANAAPALSVGGGHALLGTNPICIGIPMEEENPFILDMALSNAARSKVRMAMQNGEAIPEGWAVDENGNPTTDPAEALQGAMLPIAGYKGIGLAMAVDILAGLLSGSAFGGKVGNLDNPDHISDSGCMVICIDPLKIMPQEQYREKISEFSANVHENKGILPGEHSYIKRPLDYWIEIKDSQMEEIRKFLKELDINIELRGGNV